MVVEKFFAFLSGGSEDVASVLAEVVSVPDEVVRQRRRATIGL